MWLEHPRYVPARERLIAYLTSDRYRFRRLSPVVFLCGAANSSRRDDLRDYLKKHRDQLRVFYAEPVWEQIASRPGAGALKMESDLAALADLVLIVVESPGTFTELGAFSLHSELRKKLLAIVDVSYKDHNSFISTGPLRWIDHESTFRPTVYVSLSRILEAVGEIEERIDRIPPSETTRISDLGSSPRHLLFFLCDLVSVIHPATPQTVEYYLSRIVPSLAHTSSIDVSTLIGLAVAMRLLRKADLDVAGNRQTFVSPAEPHRGDHPFHHTRYLHLPSQRAEHISVLLTIPTAAEILRRLSDAS